MRFSLNLIGDSTNLGEGLATESVVLRVFFKLPASFSLANVVEEHSRRTMDSCQSFSEN
jgi:hypothetical protein